MLRDLAKDDWHRLLGLSSDRIPPALILRGTRNLRRNYDYYAELFTDIVPVGSPNGLFEDLFVGSHAGRQVGFACVYGAAMASEITHLFGCLGTKFVLQTGCCGAWAPGVQAGDLFVASRAFCGEGAAQYYVREKQVVHASTDLTSLVRSVVGSKVGCHSGGMYTTAALLAENKADINVWARDGWDAVDMETATTFAVAEHFGMTAAAVHFVFDNPLQLGDIVTNDLAKDDRRAAGNELIIQASLRIVAQFLASEP